MTISSLSGFPRNPVEPGVPLQYHYKLYWSKRIPFDTGKARITSTYTGIGGVSGMLETNKRKSWLILPARQAQRHPSGN